jgi:hypothetical protein
MIRNTLIALAATAGLIGATEFPGNDAQASVRIRIGLFAPCRPAYYRGPIVGAPVVVRPVVPAPIVYAPAAPPPVVVAPAYPNFDVLYRSSSSAPWQLYATYPSYQAAQAIIPNLQSSGMWVMVEQH